MLKSLMKAASLDQNHPHRRFNPLTSEWLLVSPQRTERPWQGEQQSSPSIERPEYEPSCYLCPGNERANGVRNPNYRKPYVFANDFAALLPDTPPAFEEEELFRAENAQGSCRVICFSPKHNLTLPDMPVAHIAHIVRVWMAETAELGQKYSWIQIFENKGTIMGSSNDHPHGQIWASRALPTVPAKEDGQQQIYMEKHKRPLLVEYLERELQIGERLVAENDHWAVLVPYWAIWPYEILLLPKRQIAQIIDLNAGETVTLAQILQSILQIYDHLFNVPFPYTMGWHGAPFFADHSDHWLLHAHAYPPLLRSAIVKKFMVGYEMLGEPQRDFTPEQAAETLRSLVNK